MFWRFLTRQHRQAPRAAAASQASLGLQVTLWIFWSLVVVGVGYASWHADFVAHRAINTLGLVIHCLVTGVIGLVVVTMIELHLEPWRFVDTKE